MRPTTQIEKFSALQSLGFNVPVHGLVAKADLEKFYEDAKHTRADLAYEVDGIVFSVNDLAKQAALGVSADKKFCPHGQVALKFPAKSGVIIIREIYVSTDGGQHLSPVAVFDPIELADAEIRRAHLKSFRWMTSRKARVEHFIKEYTANSAMTRAEATPLAEEAAGTEECVGIGSVVEIVRSGDVIPTIKRVISNVVAEVQLPETCPCCGAKVVEAGAYLDCSDDACPAKEANRMVRFLTNLRIKGLGQATLVDYARAGITLIDFFQQDDFAGIDSKVKANPNISDKVWAKIRDQLRAAQK